ncbi:MAG: DNA cytosine methyltransferase [Pseudohongiellaceae bacterium]|nr:DNA cytosine methyltransferase [Pseudohongiellaceae bacterium]
MNQNYRSTPQLTIPMHELVVDNFAGGGGASMGIEQAIGRPVDIAINHDPDAIAMHKVNHPSTKHYCESVWDIKPIEVTNGQPVGLAWFSPDCKHFSKAKGSTPVKKEIRGLAWVALRWAATVKPRIIALENVEEFITWGPVVDGKPCPERKGKIFESFVKQLRALGYQVQWKTLIASDFGVPTIRKRFFLVARCDGEPIVWPTPTHGNPNKPGFKKSGLKKWRTAAEIIDWSIPCPSIFERKRPLAENTLKRIARGIHRFVLNNPEPFIVRIGQQGFGGDRMQYSINDPLTTVTTKAEHCLVVPSLVQTGYGERKGQLPRSLDLNKPLGTVVSGGSKHALVATFMAKHFGGRYSGAGHDTNEPLATVTATDHNALVTTHLLHLRNNCDARSADEPLPTLTAGGSHVGEVRAFLIKYYSEGGQWQDLREPMHTIPTKDRIGLVVVHGELYRIIDIGMRMLEPHELFAAQGFPSDYVIDIDAEGNKTPKYKQVARCGNSVCPGVARALVNANMNQAVTAANKRVA